MTTNPYIREKQASAYEAKLYMGSKEGYDGEEFTEDEIRIVIQEFQKSQEIIPVRISKTCFMAGDYYEHGWEIVAINYPRYPKTHEYIWSFMHSLAKHMLINFKQNRVTLQDHKTSLMVEDINRAEPKQNPNM